MRIRPNIMSVAVLSLLVAQPVDAGLLDSPPPLFGNVRGQVIYRMGPVHYRAGDTDTIISCTNVGKAEIGLAVELFDGEDQPIGTLAQAELVGGSTVNFVTSANVSIHERVVIENLPPFDFGKARVSASATGLSCVGYHRLRAVDGTIQELALELIKRIAPAP